MPADAARSAIPSNDGEQGEEGTAIHTSGQADACLGGAEPVIQLNGENGWSPDCPLSGDCLSKADFASANHAFQKPVLIRLKRGVFLPAQEHDSA